jgi:DNA-binding CsgD family transcriptional regulator
MTDQTLPQLTPRERDVLQLAADLFASEIAKRLGLRSPTIRTHLAHIHAKLRVTTRAGAVAKAMRLGLIE